MPLAVGWGFLHKQAHMPAGPRADHKKEDEVAEMGWRTKMGCLT